MATWRLEIYILTTQEHSQRVDDADLADAVPQTTKKLGDACVCHPLQATMLRVSEVETVFLREWMALHCGSRTCAATGQQFRLACVSAAH